MTDKERMLAGKLYRGGGAQLEADCARKDTLLWKLGQTADYSEWKAIFRELLGSYDGEFWIQPPFLCDYGSNIHVGKHFFANCDCVILDVCDVTIGDNVFLAPRVCIYTATHPIDPGVRNSGLEYGKPVTIGSSVWVGGNTVINPGVTIGDNVVIGSGSVVTKDIPSGVIAAGNPCRVLREITEGDRQYWETLAAEYWADPDLQA